MPAAPPARDRRDTDARRPQSAAKRRRDPLWAQLMVVVGALLMMASGGVIVGVKVLIATATRGIEQVDMLGDAAATGGGKQIQGPLNILLVGIDERPGQNEPSRSDSIIIVHVPASHDQAFLISLPRDLYVQIPAVGGLQANSEWAKINAAFSYGSERNGRAGGFRLLAETIKRVAGVSFNAGAIVNFDGFRTLVNQLGGVDMCLDLPTDSEHIGRDKTGKTVARYNHPNATPLHYNVGCQHLEGWQALDYCRQRYQFPNGDYDRTRHQQQFLKAVMKRAKDQGVTTNPAKAISAMKAAGNAFTLSTNGLEIADWAFTLRNVTDNAMVMLKTNAGKFNPTTLADSSEAEQLSDDSRTMLTALRQDQLTEFAATHPDFVSTDAAS